MRFRFSHRARADIEEVGDFIARDNPVRAASFIGELRVACRRLVDFPEAAPLRPEIGPGVGMAVHGRYVILYVVHADVLEIRRVVHGARDLDDFAV
jgi:toxin ParE1/3/4